MYVPLAHRLAIGVCRTTLHDKLTLFVQQLNTQPVQKFESAFVTMVNRRTRWLVARPRANGTVMLSGNGIAHAVCYNINPRAHVVGVYIRSRRGPKHNMNLHCAPLQHTRTPAKPRIQNVQKAANFGCAKNRWFHPLTLQYGPGSFCVRCVRTVCVLCAVCAVCCACVCLSEFARCRETTHRSSRDRLPT